MYSNMNLFFNHTRTAVYAAIHVQAGLSRKASLGPRECACSTDVGCRTTPMWALARAGAPLRRPCARQRNDSMCRYVHHGRGLASQRGRSVAAKSIYHHPNAAANSKASSTAKTGISARCSSRAATGGAAASETGVCAGARARPGNGSISRRVLTPHGPWRKAARVH